MCVASTFSSNPELYSPPSSHLRAGDRGPQIKTLSASHTSLFITFPTIVLIPRQDFIAFSEEQCEAPGVGSLAQGQATVMGLLAPQSSSSAARMAGACNPKWIQMEGTVCHNPDLLRILCHVLHFGILAKTHGKMQLKVSLIWV